MWIGHRKEIRKLTFRALALRRSSDEGLTLASEYLNMDIAFYGEGGGGTAPM